MLNEIKESELYLFNAEGEKCFEKYPYLLKYDTLIPKLGGIRRPLTVIARKVMYEDKAPGEYPDENDMGRALAAITKWCRYPSGKTGKVIMAIAELENIDLSAITDEDAQKIRAAREAFNQLGLDENGKMLFNGAIKIKEEVLNYDILQNAEKALAAGENSGLSDFMPGAEDKAIINFFSETELKALSPEAICRELNGNTDNYAAVISAADRLIGDGVIIGWYMVRPEKHGEAALTDICWKKKQSVYLSKYNYDELSRKNGKTDSDTEEGYLYKYIDLMFCKYIRSSILNADKPAGKKADKIPDKTMALYAEYLNCKNEDERFAVMMKLIDISSLEKSNFFYPFLNAKSRLRTGSIYEFKKFSLYNFKNDSSSVSYEKILAEAFHAGRLRNYALIVQNGWDEQIVKETQSKFTKPGKSWPERIMKYISAYLLQQAQCEKENADGDVKWIVMNQQETANWFTGDSALNQIHDMLNQIFYRKAAKKIGWTVIEKSGDEALLLSNSILSYSPYAKSSKNDSPDWENSTVRKHLNASLEKMLFSKDEMKKISAHKIPPVGGSAAAAESKLFLLSADELKKHEAIPKNYDISDTAKFIGRKYLNNIRGWLLRSDDQKNDAEYVDENGTQSSKDKSLVFGIRPAVWVKLSKDENPQIGDVFSFGSSYALEPVFERASVGKNNVKIRVNPDVAASFEIRPMDEVLDAMRRGDCGQFKGKTIFEDTCCCSAHCYKNEESLIVDVINPLSSVEEAINDISDFVGVDKSKSKIVEKNKQYYVCFSVKVKKNEKGRVKTKYGFSVSSLENEYYSKGFRVEIKRPNGEDEMFKLFSALFIRALNNTVDSSFRKVAGFDENGTKVEYPQISCPDDFVFSHIHDKQ